MCFWLTSWVMVCINISVFSGLHFLHLSQFILSLIWEMCLLFHPKVSVATCTVTSLFQPFGSCSTVRESHITSEKTRVPSKSGVATNLFIQWAQPLATAELWSCGVKTQRPLLFLFSHASPAWDRKPEHIDCDLTIGSRNRGKMCACVQKKGGLLNWRCWNLGPWGLNEDMGSLCLPSNVTDLCVRSLSVWKERLDRSSVFQVFFFNVYMTSMNC